MWVLISKTRTLNFKIWFAVLLIVFGLSLIQTITGKLEGILAFSWFWVCVNSLPGFIVLFLGVLKDRRAAKFIPGFVHKALLLVTILYLGFLLVSLLAESGATGADMSMRSYRMYSFFWLGPLQLIVMIGYAVFFLSPRQLFIPGESDINRAVEHVAKKSGSVRQEEKKAYYEDISNGELEKVLTKLKSILTNKGKRSELDYVILLLNQWNQNEREKHLNTIPQEAYSITRNRVTATLLELIKNL